MKGTSCFEVNSRSLLRLPLEVTHYSLVSNEKIATVKVENVGNFLVVLKQACFYSLVSLNIFFVIFCNFCVLHILVKAFFS